MVEAGEDVYFDHGGDGFMEWTKWVGHDDGLLVWDKNGDGHINDGGELFGNNSILPDGSRAAHGFAALAALDSNNDGIVNNEDLRWTELQIVRWKDSDDDGEKDALEIVDLSAAGVQSLAVAHSDSQHVDEHGNEHRQVGSYTKTDGTTATMADVWFRTDQSDTIYRTADIPEHSEAIAGLPEVIGSGRLYRLRDAMALDDARDSDGNSRLVAPYYDTVRGETRSLRELVEAFVAVAEDGSAVLDATSRLSVAEKILLRWMGAEGVSAGEYGVSNLIYTTGERMAVLETLLGHQLGTVGDYRRYGYEGGAAVNQAYHQQLEALYGVLMSQSHLEDLYEAVAVRLKEGAEDGSRAAEDYVYDFSGVFALLSAEGDGRRDEFMRSLSSSFDYSHSLAEGLGEVSSAWLHEYVYRREYWASGVAGVVSVYQDEFIGDDHINVFQTTDGGADRLEGRVGNDIYHLGIGTGHDRIEEIWRDSDFDGDGNDVIKVAPGIGTERVTLTRTRDDLIVSLLDTNGAVTDSLTVAGYYASAVARIEGVLFEDGSRWGAADFAAVALASGQGTDGADVYDGGPDGVASVLQGGKGSDVYLLGRARGNDVVREADYNGSGSAAESDVVRLKEGLSRTAVRLSRSRDHLIIEVLTADGLRVSNTLTIENYYVLPSARIERVELHDGTLVWGASDFASAVLADGGRGDDVVEGFSRPEILSGANGGNDILRGGGGGTDVYLFGEDSDHDTVDEGFRNFGSSGDTVRLVKGVSVSALSLARNRSDLIIRLSDRGAERFKNNTRGQISLKFDVTAI